MGLSIQQPLTEAHDVSAFSCGKPSLDHWLKTRALSNQQKGFTAVIVVHDDGRVLGFYGLAPTAVVPSGLPRSIRTGRPPDPVPCLLLAQLATDLSWAGRGIGTGLLKHALERCVTAAGLIGGRALVVNAVDSEASEFWRRRGFLPSRDDPLILFRSIAAIAASLSATTEYRQDARETGLSLIGERISDAQDASSLHRPRQPDKHPRTQRLHRRVAAAWSGAATAAWHPGRLGALIIGSTAVTAMASPRTIHDLYGFPQWQFDFRYPAPGLLELAGKIVGIAKPDRVGCARDQWGLDHGTWSMLAHLYPEAACQ